jgi:hypothetical protein
VEDRPEDAIRRPGKAQHGGPQRKAGSDKNLLPGGV